MRVSPLAQHPKPVVLVELDDSEARGRLDWVEVAKAVETTGVGLTWLDVVGSGFRAVKADRLPQVLATGIDVEPTDRHLYVDNFEKAMEYGGWPKVMLALDWDHLQQPFRRVRPGTAPEQVEAWRRTYPREVRDAADRLFLVRASITRFDQYDIDYGLWIPGSPWDALRALLVVADPGSAATVTDIRSAIEGWAARP